MTVPGAAAVAAAAGGGGRAAHARALEEGLGARWPDRGDAVGVLVKTLDMRSGWARSVIVHGAAGAGKTTFVADLLSCAGVAWGSESAALYATPRALYEALLPAAVGALLTWACGPPTAGGGWPHEPVRRLLTALVASARPADGRPTAAAIAKWAPPGGAPAIVDAWVAAMQARGRAERSQGSMAAVQTMRTDDKRGALVAELGSRRCTTFGEFAAALGAIGGVTPADASRSRAAATSTAGAAPADPHAPGTFVMLQRRRGACTLCPHTTTHCTPRPHAVPLHLVIDDAEALVRCDRELVTRLVRLPQLVRCCTNAVW